MAGINNLVTVHLWHHPVARTIFSSDRADDEMPQGMVYIGQLSNTTWDNIINGMKDAMFNQHDAYEDLEDYQHKFNLKQR